MKATILGGRGFIGRHLVATLESLGWDCWVPERDDPKLFLNALGTVFYCIGLTADFRTRPFATVDAHVGRLQQILEHGNFEKIIYLSSSRVYAGCEIGEEGKPLLVDSARPDDLYNLSKLMGESLVFQSRHECGVARLSNVLGIGMDASNFIGAVLVEAKETGCVHFRTALSSAKDYIWIDDAVAGLIAIATDGGRKIYNVASGVNLTHNALAEMLIARGIRVSVADYAPVTCFPPISVSRLTRETAWRPAPIMPRLEALLDQFQLMNRAPK